MQGHLSGYSHARLEIKADQWNAAAWEWRRGREGKGGGNEGKREKEQVLCRKKATALNLDLSCCDLEEHTCTKQLGARVCPSEAESWGYLLCCSVVAVLRAQIRARLGWASLLPRSPELSSSTW